MILRLVVLIARKVSLSHFPPSIETNTGWMAFLAKCGNLETLILEYQHWYDQPLDVIPEIVLAKLHTLAVAGVCHS